MKQINQFLITTLFVLLSCTSAFAFDCEVDGIYYNRLSTDELGVTSGTSKYTGDIVIPETVMYRDKVFKVTQITANAFKSCNITSVSIPQSVTAICSSAFSGCSSLSSIVIPEGVNELGSSAFSGCTKATSVSLPNSITSIGSYAFENCSSITSIIIPEGVTLLQEATFKGCSSLTSVVLPKSLTEIGNNVFQNCSTLSSITLPQELKYISKYAFAGCGSLVSVNIQGTIEKINDYAFQDCSNLTSIFLPEGLKEIGNKAFANCSGMKTFTMPVSVTSISNNAFSSCSGLEKVIVKDIASWCRINFASFTSNPLYYAKHLYSDDDTEITELIITNKVSRIGDYAFYNADNLSKIYILPNDYNTYPIKISNDTFSNSCYTWTDLFVPEGKKDAYEGTNYWNKFKSISEYNTTVDGIKYRILSSSKEVAVTKKGDNVVYSGDIVIPEKISLIGMLFDVISIDSQAFKDCNGLTSITIPNSVTSIGQYAFWNCSKLSSITLPGSISSIEMGMFENCFNLTSITIPNSVTSIGNEAFSGCSKLTSVTIPNSVMSIGKEAFEWCSNLTSMIVESNNVYYDSRNNCNAIIETSTNTLIAGCNNTIIPNSVASIGNNAFFGCSGLTSISIPNSVTSIGDYAFSHCLGLTSISIPNSVTSIGSRAFSSCSGLTSIMVEESNSIYDSRDNCNAIIETATNTLIAGCKNTIIPNSVASIGNNAFFGCSGLTSISIPNSVTSIGDYAFYYCKGPTSVTIPNSVISIGERTFDETYFSTVISLRVEPTAITGRTSYNRTFSTETFDYATLYVPNGTIEIYKATEGWKDFANIVEGTPAGITSVTLEKETPNAPIYDLNGRRLTEPQKGINIIGGKKILNH